jgi:hypothetical protein
MHTRWWLLFLWGCACGLLRCAPGLVPQPDAGQPHALLVFPESIRVVALDTHPIDPRVRLQVLRVTPGRHQLGLLYTGPSMSHVGQQGDPTCVEVHAGQQYQFTTWTRGIIWRPVVEKSTVIPGYCTTHPCRAGEAHVGPPLPVILSCPQP